jgi:aminoglycoside phosphotransferase (APT) family kinase protein
MDDLKTLTLLARGGQSDIYALGEDRIIRVPRRSQDHERIRYEYDVYRQLDGSGLDVPRAYELVEIRGSPCIVMQRITGLTMTDEIKRRPFSLKEAARELAALHLAVLATRGGDAVVKAADKARFCITASASFSPEEKATLTGLVSSLPEGSALCHGDFHPGNIMRDRGRTWIIDWSAASRGDPVSDIAHTYLLLSTVPRVPGISGPENAVRKLLAGWMARAYLKEMALLRPFDRSLLHRWLVIKAAERTWYGLPDEKRRQERLVRRWLGSRRRST